MRLSTLPQLFLLLLSSMLFIACSDSDDNNSANKSQAVPESLVGEWRSTNNSRFFYTTPLKDLTCNSTFPAHGQDVCDFAAYEQYLVSNQGQDTFGLYTSNEWNILNQVFPEDQSDALALFSQSLGMTFPFENMERLNTYNPALTIRTSGEAAIHNINNVLPYYKGSYCQGIEIESDIELTYQLEPNWQVIEVNETYLSLERDLSEIEPQIAIINTNSEERYCAVPLSTLSSENIDFYTTFNQYFAYTDFTETKELIFYTHASAETLEVEYRLSEEDDQAVLYLDKLFDINGPSDLVDAKYIKIEHNETDENDSTE